MRNNCCISSSDSSEVTLNKCVNKSMKRLEKPDAELVKEEQIESLSEKLENMNVNDQAMSNSKNIDSSQRKVPDGGKRSRSRKKKAKEAKITEGVATGSNETQIQKKRVRYRLRTPKKKVDSKGYPDYITEEEVTQGLLDGSLVKGIIRINQRNSRDAYVSSMIKGDTDYCIKSILDQNRALEGDEVILRIKSEAEWDEGRKTAVVVYISKMIHSRTSVGKLYPITRNDNFAAFFPRDKRFPVVHIPSISWPKTFKSDPQKSSKNLFVAKITEWTNIEHAKGLIIENIGISGDLKVENLAILKGCGLDHESFGNEVLKYLPKMDNLQADWLEGREDLRTECIFSIDPLTARDLDDAVSCKTLPDGNLEIGVHIADVSHFLEEGTELDKQVGWKATTIYMVDHVYHMLPVELCMGCSLLPAKDKLSFSVFWTMTPDGEILTTRFAKTIMNSCVQLAYEHAQAIIDDPDNFDASSFPKITNGYSIADVKDVVLKLYNISKILRRRRFENGALRIDQIKLSFNLDPETGLPIDYFTHELKEANWLIEEFMLLANISVAEKIMDSFPDISFLRLHEAPKESMMKELKAGLESVGIHVDTSSAMSIQSSLKKYSSDDFLGKIRGAVLNHLFAKPMVRARYFCPGIEKAATSYGHFALNIPLYTHFTSPIRRYADIMVHRLLTASLGLSKKPMWDPAFVGDVAQRCNILKYNAKKAQEESTKLYLGLFITKRGPFIRNAAVVDVKERTFDALVLDSGEIVRIYTNEIEGARFKLEEIPCLDLNTSKNASGYQKKNWQMRLSYPPLKNLPGTEVVIELFSLVQVELTMCPKKRRILAKLLRPIS
ncbi:hypothetical protein HHI36_013994 [Cryptolaemus montrouzieri]|uniref:RNB domain-containing protein n=1 Tax=Cryptolaemus montrouzieri TaxID=559131 RepID=A0ABD2N1F9_9CUCU